MDPWHLLAFLLLITAGAIAWQVGQRLLRARRLRELAGRLHVHYSPQDRFGLSARVAKYFPTPGIADVRISDLLYHSDETGHRYVFTADYTRGILGTKHRIRGVMLLREARGASGREGTVELQVAEEGPILARYESLLAG